MSTPPIAFSVDDRLSLAATGFSFYAHELLARRPRHQSSRSWQCDAGVSAPRDLDGTVFTADNGPHGPSEAVVVRDDLIARITVEDSHVEVFAAADDEATASGFVGEMLDRFPQPTIIEGEPRVPISFWSLTPQGAHRRTRKIDVPPWEQIQANYPAKARDPLEGMMAGFEPGVGGQLLLWHGPPGTGKTWALRALAWEWRMWCDVHYVTDPEDFFGRSAAYMQSVLLAEDDDEPRTLKSASTKSSLPEVPKQAVDGRWRLLVMEDTGELMSADAADRSGQGLSRLLNVVDGLLGQGLRILVLVTTNEELRNLHPAVSRPGRCAATVLFGGFDAGEAQVWLEDHEVDDGVYTGKTLAELFALRAGRAPARAAKVGFGL